MATACMLFLSFRVFHFMSCIYMCIYFFVLCMFVYDGLIDVIVFVQGVSNRCKTNYTYLYHSIRGGFRISGKWGCR